MRFEVLFCKSKIPEYIILVHSNNIGNRRKTGKKKEKYDKLPIIETETEQENKKHVICLCSISVFFMNRTQTGTLKKEQEQKTEIVTMPSSKG